MGTGEDRATAGVEALEEWGILEKVIGMCFDTTPPIQESDQWLVFVLSRNLA